MTGGQRSSTLSLVVTDTRNRNLITAVAVVLAVLLTLAIVIALQPPATLDPATPEGTAQAYFRALADGDVNGAVSFFDTELAAEAERCGVGQLREVGAGLRVVITETEFREGRAYVSVEITESYGSGPFGRGSSTFDETLVMELHGDVWLISRAPWPLYYFCPGV